MATNKWIVTFKTAKQADRVEWALDPMHDCHEDFYGERPCGGASIEIPKLNFMMRGQTPCALSYQTDDNGKPYPVKMNRGWTMTGGHPETIADLLYRLEGQAQDMSEMEFGRPDKPALNAAKLIREVTGVDHDGFGRLLKSLNQEGA